MACTVHTSDRRFLVLEELVPNETDHETRLAHRRVSQQHQLEVAYSPRCHSAAGVLARTPPIPRKPLSGLRPPETPLHSAPSKG